MKNMAYVLGRKNGLLSLKHLEVFTTPWGETNLVAEGPTWVFKPKGDRNLKEEKIAIFDGKPINPEDSYDVYSVMVENGEIVEWIEKNP